ncbi:peptidyl-prolyl cis-trans isomerase FKBP13 chloroplastic [Tripterygium wilfordii]|uniref:peptidylprolyl isomerase n=1 Tax=Tripterygium wilfordii TaxID=458696 RepID=A0A7J7C535_TRIWF|nr:peptidyl-prolyl cis-trans isomerase FKBP13, chloroplastic [Tripterygium wilfordii]KAF5729241.1 peptidyl-prolyl cis-trans isomerase FKBP13 chloroplastic [Tripterygium wilfordii]
MSSLAFSAGTCTPRTRSKTNSAPLIRNKKEAFLKPPQNSCSPLQVHLDEKATLFSRRESIAFGLSFSFLDVLLVQPKPSSAAEKAPCELTEAPSGLAFCDKVVGTGPEAVKGQLIKAHYVGKLENGNVFDSSYNRGKPLAFRVGVGEVIKGWDQGILGGEGIPPMLAGGKRVLKLPPELGYGVRGAGCRGGSCIIPPDSVLFFDVEFIGKA